MWHCVSPYENEDPRSCANKPSCINCGGEHSAVGYRYPKFLQRRDISKIIAVDNIPFQEASKKVLGLSDNSVRSLSNSNVNFPALNPPRGIKDRSYFANIVKSDPPLPAGSPVLNGNSSDPLSDLVVLDFLREIASWIRQSNDVDKLIERMRKTVKFHFQFGGGIEA